MILIFDFSFSFFFFLLFFFLFCIFVFNHFTRLLKAAEEVHLPKALRQEYGGGLKEFIGSETSCFEGSDCPTEFFTAQERQSLVLHLLHTIRAGQHDLASLPGVKLVEGQAIIPKCISAGIISQVKINKNILKLSNVHFNNLIIKVSSKVIFFLNVYYMYHLELFFYFIGVPTS